MALIAYLRAASAYRPLAKQAFGRALSVIHHDLMGIKFCGRVSADNLIGPELCFQDGKR